LCNTHTLDGTTFIPNQNGKGTIGAIYQKKAIDTLFGNETFTPSAELLKTFEVTKIQSNMILEQSDEEDEFANAE
jgi:hypothetical protein